MKLHRNPIAIVGMASIFPEAPNLQTYWENILNKLDCVIDVPPSHWSIAEYYDPEPTTPDKTYCKRGAFMPEVDFDPLEFGLPPNILEVTDTSQLLSLVVARDALIDAGYLNAAEAVRERTGCVLGVGGGQKLVSPLNSRLQYPVWTKVLRSVGIPEADIPPIVEKMKAAYVKWEENSFPGALGNVVSGRIANRFDLGGINTVVDAACASSLSAVNLAIGELVNHRADMMITGGVDTDNSIFMYMCFSKTPAFSRGDNPRPFDVESSGMMVGEGIGMVVLKRLADAERDGDRIYAVIKGIGSSSDGRYKSIYAPRSEGQERALRRAYEDAGFTPDTVGFIEAHGTGTVAGDIAEAQTLVRTFGDFTDRKQQIALGSVKSQIGHTKAAAGAAGLIKAALALHHKVLPPMINIDQPNPKLKLDDSPFYLNIESRPWLPPEGQPRRAGVSAFGFGGTNFHVVLEEYTPEQRAHYRLNHTAQPIVVGGSTPADLMREAEALSAALQAEGAAQKFRELTHNSPDVPLNFARVGVAAASPKEAAEMLRHAVEMIRAKPEAEELSHPKGIFYRRAGMNLEGRVVALFPGQGAQYLEMGRELALNFPEVREAYRSLDALFKRDQAQPLSEVVFPTPAFDEPGKQAQAAALQRTEYVQPAVGAFSAGLWRVLVRSGFRADFLAGHSFGELSALWAGGALSDDDYFMLVRARGKAMAPPADTNFDAGTMYAVTGTHSQITALPNELLSYAGVTVANHNSPTQAVIAGPARAAGEAAKMLTGKGYKAVQLAVSAAFHTPLVGHAQVPFAAAVRSATFRVASAPVYSNASGGAYPADPAAMKQILADHILQSVQFQRQVENIHAAGGYLFVEVGPRSILSNLVKDILGDKPHRVVALNGSRQKDSDRQFREAIAHLRVLGVKIGAVDPYQMPTPEPPKKKKSMTVKLGGTNYISDKTRKGFEDALNDGWKISLSAAPAKVTPQTQPAAPAKLEIPAPKEAQHNPMTASPALSVAPVNQAKPAALPAPMPIAPAIVGSSAGAPDLMSVLERGLSAFEGQQREMTRLHEQYLKHQSEAFNLLFQLVQGQTALASGNPAPGAMEAISSSIALFREHQAETLRAHEQYIARQGEQLGAYVEIIKAGYGAVASALTHGSLSVAPVSEKPRPVAQPAVAPVVAVPTPAPVKPVVMVAAPPPAPVAAPAPVAVPAPQPAPVMAAPVPVQPVTPPPTAPAPVNGTLAKALTEALLNVVSEKTGYPVETLELGMDVEADLGIDSIKRVEILGAMRDQFPELPQMKPEELAELRTLGQIVDYMNAHLGGKSAAPEAAPAAPPPAPVIAPPAPVATAPVMATPSAPVAPVAAPAPAPVNGTLAKALTEALLNVVSEKTGYPVETLELGMDVEADLGIDSIKRVEILGAMRDQFPELPQMKPEELAELRTLGQIVDYMNAHLSGSASPVLVPSAPGATMETRPNGQRGDHGITRAEVRLRYLPAPDQMTFGPNPGSVCVVVEEGTALTTQLVESLGTLGWRVVTLAMPENLVPNRAALPVGVTRITLSDTSESSLQGALNSAAQYGPISGFIHLNPTATPANGLFADAENAIIKAVFLLAKHLKAPLTESAKQGRSLFFTVARLDGMFGLAANGNFGAVAGGLSGLVKTLNLEWGGVFCRALDLAPDLSAAESAARIMTEVHDPNRLLVEVAYGAQGRVTLAAEVFEVAG
ncbi:MAG: acyltransferase domain-containing protein [Anaerolineae bacterium]|nr:acyltransferase domain-containing protein [Anaerolineae bacterium]